MPIKKKGCTHQFDDEPKCVSAVRNDYHCDDCDVSWTDEWSCGCDDDCPECGTPHTPEKSEKLAVCACEYLGR